MSKSLWLARSWLFAMPEKCHVSCKPFMAMLIFALASFSMVTELPLESSCFGCQKVVETKNPYWPCVGLKVNFRKVNQQAASEASNEICCYQAGKSMNSKSAKTWRTVGAFPASLRCNREKNCPQCYFSNVLELLRKRKSRELQCKRKS